MSFSEIPPVDTAETLLDMAIGRAKKRYTLLNREKKGEFLQIKRDASKVYVDILCATLREHLQNILDTFPDTRALTPFYQKLVEVTIEEAPLKKSLGAVNWAVGKVTEFNSFYVKRIHGSRTIADASKHRASALGRIASVVKQIGDNLSFLNEARRVMRSFPTVKSLPTVCIAGFPNVGKSTLLKRITLANPEINSYAFTTKKLNFGYMKHKHKKIQFIDTPGSLNRFSKMNAIEKQAELALKYVADVILYVFDISPECDYSLSDQKKLLKKVKEFDKPVISYVSKQDLLEENALDKLDNSVLRDYTKAMAGIKQLIEK